MTPQEIALARKNSYELLGGLFLDGIREEDRPVLEQLPELAAVLPTPFDPDEVAANHQTLFGFNLLPFESIFVTAERVLGGEATDLLLRHAADLGYQSAEDAAIDHIGQQLLLLGHLCGGEAYMLARGEDRQAALLAHAQEDWLEQHLLRWLAPFQSCLMSQGDSFFTEVGLLALSVIADHWQQRSRTEIAAWTTPVPANILEDEKSSLKDISVFLMTPLSSGIFLTKDDLSRLGKQFRLPRGFGSREQMMSNLLRSAAQYDDVPELMLALQVMIEGVQAQYESWVREWPTLSTFMQPWQALLENSHSLTHEIGLQAASLAQREEVTTDSPHPGPTPFQG